MWFVLTLSTCAVVSMDARKPSPVLERATPMASLRKGVRSSGGLSNCDSGNEDPRSYDLGGLASKAHQHAGGGTQRECWL